MWSRRQFLGALGASGASGALGQLLGCAARQSATAQATAPGVKDEHLAKALTVLEANTKNARVWSRETRSFELSLDHEQERFDVFLDYLVVLSGERDGKLARIALHDPTPQQLALAAASLSEHAIAPALPLQPVRSSGWNQERTQAHSEYREPLRSLFAAAQGHGSSRIVYQYSYLQSIQTEQRFLSRSHNLRSRSQRTRGGLIMGAWAGGEVATAEAQVSGQGGPRLVKLSDAKLASVADETLAHLHARSAPSGAQEVLLSPKTAAMLAHHAIGRAQIAGPLSANTVLRVTDNPAVGYGALAHDDEAVPTSEHVLVDTAIAPLQASGRRRFDRDAMLRVMPTHLEVESGDSELGELVARVKTGVLLEGPELCGVDSRGERLSLLSSRGREIVDGRFTGRLFARTLCTASISDFISDTVALGRDAESVSFEDHGIASSSEAPHWLSQAKVHSA
ncbi:MAG: twin-arginine translocation signal domain-containing protein [Myxococcales bacterium]|nr:twin-arginine translocation signal domain-containing protein [Myxococcales bacterium]